MTVHLVSVDLDHLGILTYAKQIALVVEFQSTPFSDCVA